MADVFTLEGQVRVDGASEATRQLTQVGSAADRTAGSMQRMESASASAQTAQARTSAITRNASAEIATLTDRVQQASVDFRAGEINAGAYAATLASVRGRAEALNREIGGVSRSQGEQFRALLKATEGGATELSAALARVGQDVKLAQAAFKAGTISSGEFKLSMTAARNEAVALANGFGRLSGKDLAAYSAILTQTEQKTLESARGMGTLRSTMGTLAAQSIGLKTSVASATGALGAMAIGTALTVGILAGIAAIGFAYDKFTAKSREQKKVTDDLRRSFHDLVEEYNHGANAARAAIDQQINQEQRALTKLREDLAKATTRATNTGRDVDEARRLELVKQVTDAEEKLRGLRAETMQDDAQREVEATNRRIAALIRYAAAGRATETQLTELRNVQRDALRELASLTDSYLRTADGAERAADLMDRVDRIQEAFDARVRAGLKDQKDAVQAIQDRIAYLITLERTQGATTESTARLQQAVKDLDALQQKANLTDRQQLNLLQARNAALEQLVNTNLAAQRAAGIRRPTGGFGIDTDLIPGPPDLTPSSRFGPQPAKPSSVFGATPDFTKDAAKAVKQSQAAINAGLDAVTDEVINRQQELARLGQQLGRSFTDAVVQGLGSGGGIAGAFKSILGQMLASLGEMAIQFGLKAIITAQLIDKIMKALAKLNPVVAIAGGIALVALGRSLLGNAARESFGGGGANLAPISQTYTITTSQQTAQQASRVTPAQPVTVNQMIIGVNDPAAQRAVALMVEKAANRGAG